MSDTETTGLGAYAGNPAATDKFMMVDVSDTTMAASGTNKYIEASYISFRTNAETLTNKTLTAPVIGDFTSANHAHTNAAGGGQLDHGAALTGLADDDHTQYLLATGSRPGASSQAQTFTNGVVAPTLKPASDGATAVQVTKADGTTAIIVVNTTDSRVGMGSAVSDTYSDSGTTVYTIANVAGDLNISGATNRAIPFYVKATFSGDSPARVFRGYGQVPLANTSALSGIIGMTFFTEILGPGGVTGNVGTYASALTLNNSSATVAQYVMYQASTPTVTAGTLTKQVGFQAAQLTQATNNTLIQLGGTTIPTGNFAIYNQSAYDNYIAGKTGFGTSSPGAMVHVAGGLTASAWGVAGIQTRMVAATFTDSSTAASGTATNAVANSFAQPTFAATNATVTMTHAATMYIANAPAAGTNVTITNAYALWVDAGATRLDGDVGFFATSPASQQTVTGSRGGNAALADLLTKLATYGIIIDGTSA